MADDHAQSHPHVNYFGVFLALCVCTALSVIFDVVHVTPSLLVFLVLAVACAKAMFVMTYFMHLKFEGNWKFVILFPTAVLSVGLMVALAPDMAMHYYTNEAPQMKYAAEHGGEEHTGHGAAHNATDSHSGSHDAHGH